MSVIEEHSELIHYTSARGLAGILSSQTLWATHSAFLNDASEIRLFFDHRLQGLLEGVLRQEIERSAEFRHRLEQGHPGELLERIIGTVAGKIRNSICNVSRQFNQPYIVSFCSTKFHNALSDGLLSQWRGYGKDGGFALVFDTKGLQELLEVEVTENWYQHFEWGDVHYYQEESAVPAPEELATAEHAIGRSI